MCLRFRFYYNGGCNGSAVCDGFWFEYRFCIADCGLIRLGGFNRFHFIIILVQRFHFFLVRHRVHGRFGFFDGCYNGTVGVTAAVAVAIDGQFVLAGRWFYEAFPRYFWFGAIAVLFKLGNAVTEERRPLGGGQGRFFRNVNFRF